MVCTRCGGEGFLNIHQVPDDVVHHGFEAIKTWMLSNSGHDVTACDCCGDGEAKWHGEPGEHNGADYGPGGPYGYNGGLPECS